MIFRLVLYVLWGIFLVSFRHIFRSFWIWSRIYCCIHTKFYHNMLEINANNLIYTITLNSVSSQSCWIRWFSPIIYSFFSSICWLGCRSMFQMIRFFVVVFYSLNFVAILKSSSIYGVCECDRFTIALKLIIRFRWYILTLLNFGSDAQIKSIIC